MAREDIDLVSGMESAHLTNGERRPGTLPIFVFLLLVFAYKGNDALTHPQFWAEDGAIFFQQQLDRAVPLLGKSYAGYLSVIPRFVAWIGTAFSDANQPTVYNVAAWILGAWSVAFATQRIGRHVPVFVTLAAVVLTTTSGEVFGTLTNLQWFLHFALAAMLLVPPPRTARAPTWLRLAVCAALGLTGPFSVVLLVTLGLLAGVAWLMRRLRVSAGSVLLDFLDSLDKPVIATAAAAAAIQLVVFFHAPATAPHAAVGVALQTALGKLIPIHIFGSQILTSTGWSAIYLLLAGLLVAGRALDRDTRIVVALLVVSSLLITVAGLTKMPFPFNLDFAFSDRYYVMTKIAFWLLVWAAWQGQTTDSALPALAVALAMTFIAIGNPDKLRRQPLLDLEWRHRLDEATTPGTHRIPINPNPMFVTIRVTAAAEPDPQNAERPSPKEKQP